MLHTDLLAIAIQINQTAMLVGKPGIGKTAITKDLVQQIGAQKHNGKYPLVFQSLAQIMPEDLAGAQVPNHDSKTMDAYMMGAIKSLVIARQGVYFGDEYGSCSGGVRAAFLNAAQDRLFGDTHLPDVSVVCAMNPPDIAANGSDMTPPESNRFFWIDWTLDDGAWLDYMRGGRGATSMVPILPNNWQEKFLPKAKSLVASFLSRNRTLIHQMPAPEKATGPWPSHRSWTNASHMLAAVLSTGKDLASDHVALAVSGCVGKAVADTFFAWVKDMDLPDPEDLLKDPKNAHKLIPERHDRAIVTLESVAAAATEQKNDPQVMVKRWNAAWEILEPVINFKQDQAEPAAKILANKKPSGTSFPDCAGKILKVRRDLGVSRTGIT